MGLYRPTVTRKRPDGTRFKEKSRVWWGKFQHPNTGKLTYLSLKTRDKSAAKTLLRVAERRAAMEAAGLTNPYEQHLARPLAEHIKEWKSDLHAKNNTEKHVDTITGRAERLVEWCRFRRWADVSASRVQSLLCDLRAGRVDGYEQGVSVQTSNFYRQAIKQFCRWMVRDGRADKSPVEHLSAENVRTDRRHDRRPFETDELRYLIADAQKSGPRYGVAGPDRAMLYRVAVETGLRANELKSVRWTDIHLNADQPTITVRAAYSKRRRNDTLPLTAGTALLLGSYREQCGGKNDDHVFRMPHSCNVARMLRGDMDAARTVWIDDADSESERERRQDSSFLSYVDGAGRYADFHALRHTFITNLTKAGIAPKLAQDLARHSDFNLTFSRYSHTLLADQAEAVKSLPDLSIDDDQDDFAAA